MFMIYENFLITAIQGQLDATDAINGLIFLLGLVQSN